MRELSEELSSTENRIGFARQAYNDNVLEFNPDIVAVSAGFDTYKQDPLLELELDMKAYYEIAKMIKFAEKPVFAALEGGYSTDLPLCIYEFLRGLKD